MCEFEVFVSKADFKFSCAHFISYKGFRERLHGHNYQASIKIIGSDTLNADGYVIDFGDIKKEARSLCKSINEFFICPMKSSTLDITENDGNICLVCEDGAHFSFPRSDCALLPIVHSSAEEISHWLWCGIVRGIGLNKFKERNLKSMEVSVAEATNQQATFRCLIPSSEEELFGIESRQLQKRPPPHPCLLPSSAADNITTTSDSTV
mmetsp:Transcript_1015/g.1682  ORF Transcript_1015/g.1682 Transcript_1015/m.1682 type:complete len:208 (+) Transcript_1015:44-667(+)